MHDIRDGQEFGAFPGVTVEKDALIEHSIVMSNSHIGEGSVRTTASSVKTLRWDAMSGSALVKIFPMKISPAYTTPG